MSGFGRPLLGVDVTQVDTSPQFGLGASAEKDGNVYKYLQASAAISASVPCKIATGNQVAASGNAGTIDCISPASAVADNSYAWFLVHGYGVCNVAGSTAAGAGLARVADSNGDAVTVAAGTGASFGTAQTAEADGLATVYMY